MSYESASTEPEVGMKLDQFMTGSLKVISDSPLRAAEMRNSLKNEGLKVEASPGGLANNFAEKAALQQIELKAAAPQPVAPAQTMSMGMAN